MFRRVVVSFVIPWSLEKKTDKRISTRSFLEHLNADNHRRAFAWSPPGHQGAPFTLELDATSYPWGELFELECETVGRATPRDAGRGRGLARLWPAWVARSRGQGRLAHPLHQPLAPSPNFRPLNQTLLPTPRTSPSSCAPSSRRCLPPRAWATSTARPQSLQTS